MNSYNKTNKYDKCYVILDIYYKLKSKKIYLY